jgi:hypothetical protein
MIDRLLHIQIENLASHKHRRSLRLATTSSIPATSSIPVIPATTATSAIPAIKFRILPQRLLYYISL